MFCGCTDSRSASSAAPRPERCRTSVDARAHITKVYVHVVLRRMPPLFSLHLNEIAGSPPPTGPYFLDKNKMAAPGIAPLQVTLEPSSHSGAAATHALLAAMLRASDKVSDLIFSPGRPPQVEIYGQLMVVQGPGLRVLTADDTRRIASDLIGDNKQAINILREQGSCDISFGLRGFGPLPGERFHPARQLRCGHAGDSHRDSRILRPGLAASTGGNCRSQGRHCSGDRGTRIGEVFHAGGAAGSHQ